MIAALKTLLNTWQHLNHRGYIYVWGNLLAVVCSIPLVTAPAAWAGLVKMSYNAYLSPTSDINDFWSGFRENLGRSLVMAVLNVVIVMVNVSNLISYSTRDDFATNVMRFVWILSLLIWFAVQFYMWPLFYHMKTPTLIGAMRNALVMLWLNPLFTLAIVLAAVLLMVISSIPIIFPVWFLLTISALACLATGAVLNRLGVTIYDPEMLQDES